MRILIDTGHPAHIHYYRNLAANLEEKGHEVFWTTKDIDISRRLLNHYKISYKVFRKKSDSLPGKALGQLAYIFELLRYCRAKRIDIAVGTSVTIAQASLFSKMKSLFFEDDDDAVVPLSARTAHPFATNLISPDCLRGKQKRRDTIYYSGYHELAYLHPERFTPDPSILKEAGVEENEPFFIMRFNVFKAHHDRGVRGLTLDRKLKLTEMLNRHGKVFITTERQIEPELSNYRLPVAPEKIHSLLAYATMFIGDSQTMTSEAAVLGIPSLRCNTLAGRIAYLEEQEHKYGLTYGFTPDKFDNLLTKLDELLVMPDLKTEWQRRRNVMIRDKIDVTAFWTWFVHNYPESIKIIDENPDYQLNFR